MRLPPLQLRSSHLFPFHVITTRFSSPFKLVASCLRATQCAWEMPQVHVCATLWSLLFSALSLKPATSQPPAANFCSKNNSTLVHGAWCMVHGAVVDTNSRAKKYTPPHVHINTHQLTYTKIHTNSRTQEYTPTHVHKNTHQLTCNLCLCQSSNGIPLVKAAIRTSSHNIIELYVFTNLLELVLRMFTQLLALQINAIDQVAKQPHVSHRRYFNSIKSFLYCLKMEVLS